MQETKQGILIIAIGNTLRGDDGIAVLICRQLESEQKIDADILFRQQLDIGIAGLLSEYRYVLFVDACVSSQHVSIQIIETDAQTPASFTHHTAPAILQQLVQQLYAGGTQFYTCAIPVFQMNFEESITAEAMQQGMIAKAAITAWCRQVYTNHAPQS